MPFLSSFPGRATLIDVGLTAGLMVLLLLARFSLRRVINANTKLDLDQRRRWLVGVRNSLISIWVLGLAIIWASQIQSVLVSLAAVAVAVVIAGKELILCMGGAMLRSAGRLYDVGDWIEIGTHRGAVVDIGLFSSTLMEYDANTHHLTGRAVTFPNSLLWTAAVTRESFVADFVVHRFEVPLAGTDDWQTAEARLARLAREVAQADEAAMADAARQLAEAHAFVVPLPETRTELKLIDAEKRAIVVQMPVRRDRRHLAQQQVLRAYLQPAEDRAKARD
jgi:small-conductance mechanosensitive channel